MPKVSVIIPNYNHARFLDERLSSVLGQTFQDFEVIILDDCSTDGSRDVIEKYRDNPRVSRIVYNEHNSGSSFKQWDKGISLAEGELIWIAESDDSAEAKLLETLVAEFERDPKCVLAFCGAVITDENGIRSGLHPIHSRLPENLQTNGKKFLKKWLGRSNYVVNASGALFLKKAYNAMNAFAKPAFMEFRGCGDWLMWAGIVEQGNVVYVAKELNFFRQHRQNTTANLLATGTGSIENARLIDLLLHSGRISWLSALRSRVLNVMQLKSLPSSAIPEETRKRCLEAWHAKNPATALWVAYKRIVHGR